MQREVRNHLVKLGGSNVPGEEREKVSSYRYKPWFS